MKKSNDIAGISEFTVSHRLRVIQELLKIRSVAAFANEIGVDTSVLNNIMSPYGRMGKPSFDTLQKIAAKYPRVNMDWLITGKGEPLRPFGTVVNLPVPAAPPNQHAPVSEGDWHAKTPASTHENTALQQLMNVPSVLSELRVCQAEKDNLERILALKDEIIEILRKQNAD
ncbi:helix-turn-helix transcriptional regulator [Adhaeribacter sp. BT258]|uniref:Helix-turn-helix transcriptional regulator n=1 Tax=Adhaeribacter terrigena TaxID=2793070 RepID=A0ABS1C386_9BACT|nr:helix-turn-helix transcriptional regulator [Adhaeribacter terrigena]MBK0403869.1 helix-turn-helix transcriptional regulator [Adhaeribacter terrigena]